MREETLHIGSDVSGFSGNFNVVGFIDKYTNQYMVYIPSLIISGYGRTREKANEMLDQAVVSFFEYSLEIPRQKLENELAELGWQKKEDNIFSRSPIDIRKEMEEFNLDEGAIEKFALVA